jgi:beta-galactosidase
VLHIFPHWNWPGMDGQEIAVWAYSNVDRVELFLNGKSLGAKDVKKDSHLAWVVKYAPGSIEARGWKDGKLVMTKKRETTGRAAKLVMRTDRDAISADGEDVAMFSVELQDAQGRTVPITENEVTFQVSGAGKLIGVGNGDPTDHASDKGRSRKAFSGFCMALIQSSKEAGDITVEATSPGLASAKGTIAAKAVKLRPQVAVWERALPKGPGVTGLWRPVMPSGGPSDDFISMIVGTNALFVLKQDGDQLTGTAEGIAGFFGGDDVPSPLFDGAVNGDQVAFKSLNSSFAGKTKGDQLELQRTVHLPWETPTPPQQEPGRPAIGPAPDGSDPSTDTTWEVPSAIPVILRRVQR